MLNRSARREFTARPDIPSSLISRLAAMRHRFKVEMLVLCIATIVIAGCQTPRDSETPTLSTRNSTQSDTQKKQSRVTDNDARYTVIDCPDDLTTPDAVIQCGELHVRQTRETTPSPTLSIPVVWLKATTTPDNITPPLIVLGGGGPGAPLGTNAASIREHLRIFSPLIAAGRDVLIVEQRGVGASRPSTYCPEGFVLIQKLFQFDWSPERALAIQNHATAKCRDALAANGVQIGAYTNNETIVDIEALRIALGIEKWVLLGGSAAASLALGIMRVYPDSVAAAILDSPSPPEHQFLYERHRIYNDAFKNFLRFCATTVNCQQRYPDLEVQLLRTLTRLSHSPVNLSVNHPLLDQRLTFRLTRDRLLDVLFLSLYWRPGIRTVPGVIDSLSRYQHDAAIPLVESYLRVFSDDQWGDGVWMDIQCREKLPFVRDHTDDDVELLQGPYSPFAFKHSVSDMHTLCNTWQAGSHIEESSLALNSTIPSLILSGEYDPITPTRIARRVHGRLPNSQLVIMKDHGHGLALGSRCAMTIIHRFLTDTTRQPTDTCLDDKVTWLFGPR